MSQGEHDYYKSIIELFPYEGEARNVLKQLCNDIEYFLECTTDIQKYAILSFYMQYFELSIQQIQDGAGESLQSQIEFLNYLREKTIKEDDKE